MQTATLPPVASKPVYTPIELNPAATFHLFIAEQAQTDSLELLYRRCHAAKAFYLLTEATPEKLQPLLQQLPLSGALYIAGTEPYLWKVATEAQSLGVRPEQIRMLPPENQARQVFCCHCYGITDAVKSSPVACSSCGRMLEVTDHFARNHGAYFAYQVNAEDSAVIPPERELS